MIMPPDNNKLVEVCASCKTSSCYYGEFMCTKAKMSGTTVIPVRLLRCLGKENEEYWSDEYMEKVYGNPAPRGYER